MFALLFFTIIFGKFRLLLLLLPPVCRQHSWLSQILNEATLQVLFRLYQKQNQNVVQAEDREMSMLTVSGIGVSTKKFRVRE